MPNQKHISSSTLFPAARFNNLGHTPTRAYFTNKKIVKPETFSRRKENGDQISREDPHLFHLLVLWFEALLYFRLNLDYNSQFHLPSVRAWYLLVWDLTTSRTCFAHKIMKEHRFWREDEKKWRSRPAWRITEIVFNLLRGS